MAEVVGIILAAGLSSRFSGNKLLASFKGEAVIRHVVRAALASRLSPVILVLGHQAEDVIGVLSNLPLNIALNERFQDGQSTSIKKGIEVAGTACEAAMFLAADQPMLTSQIIDALIGHFWEQGRPICHPAVGGKRRNPAVLSRRLFPDLLALEGDQGGRVVIDSHRHASAVLEFQDSRPFTDVDTIDDLKALEETV